LSQKRLLRKSATESDAITRNIVAIEGFGENFRRLCGQSLDVFRQRLAYSAEIQRDCLQAVGRTEEAPSEGEEAHHVCKIFLYFNLVLAMHIHLGSFAAYMYKPLVIFYILIIIQRNLRSFAIMLEVLIDNSDLR